MPPTKSATNASVSKFVSKLKRTVERALRKVDQLKAQGKVVPKEIDDALWDCGTFLGCNHDRNARRQNKRPRDGGL